MLQKSKYEHDKNSGEIDYLYNYYRGVQDIQYKTKEVREDINNKITVNRSYEIVSFKKGHNFGEPVQYIPRGETESNDEVISKEINELNDYMVECDKGEMDSDLAEWFFICGVAYRMVLPNKNWDEGSDESPFRIYTLDPRSTFVVRYNNLDKSIAMGVTYTVSKEDNSITYYVYTHDMYYEINDVTGIVKEENFYLNQCPIIEYVNNNARMGAFEPVLSLLDCINSVQSNRLDDIEQSVNSFMAVFGADMDEETYKRVQEWKMLVLPEGTDAKYISATLMQNDIQTYVDDLYQTILTICGMPNRNGGSSTSDTGTAVQLRDGWQTAEAQAKSVEKTFKRSERTMLRLILRILKDMGGTHLKLKNIDIKFARRYTDNVLTKVQALGQLLDAGIKPEIAIATVGIWNDPTDVAIQSKKYLSKWEIEEEEDEEDVLPIHGQEIVETQNLD